MQADARIASAVLALPEIARADALLTYRSFGSEVETFPIIEAASSQGLTVALPRCLPRRHLSWHVVDGAQGLVRGPWGIEEPDPHRHPELVFSALRNPVVLVPALAFDRMGHRLGYGGGFYDTFLKDFDGLAIGICRETQLLDSLWSLGAVEDHDVPVDVVISDRRVLRVEAGEGV